jgi:hypothetical protein
MQLPGKGFLDAFSDIVIVCHAGMENVKVRVELEEEFKCDLISCLWNIQVVRSD